ncbi:putative transcription factor B3-Domain family [Helianthus anomalus]
MAKRKCCSFFKLLLDPSAPHLPIPPDFVTNHLENQTPKDPVIRSANGEYTWRVKMKKIGESLCFSYGWESVVQDIQLGFGDFLVFRLVNKSMFKMIVFGPNGCEKEFPPKIKIDDHEDVDEDVKVEYDDDDDDDVKDEFEDEFEDEDEEDGDEGYEEVNEEEEDDEEDGEDDGDGEGGIDGNDGDPFFMVNISKIHNNMMRLPADFADMAGIEGDGTLTAANLDGKEWQLGVRVGKDGWYYLSAGWIEFRRSNDLCEGDECVFKFITSEDKLLLARVSKNKRPAKHFSGKKLANGVGKRKRKLPVRSSGKVPASKVETRAARGGGKLARRK